MTKEQVFIAKGSAPWYSNNWLDINKVISMNKLDSGATVACDGNVTDMTDMFSDCPNLLSIDLSNFDTSNVTIMSGMFAWCTNLTSINLSNFDTSKVIDMTSMFDGCHNLTAIDLSNFDTSNVKDMYSMFYDCPNLTTIKGVIDMESCVDYETMFSYCSKLKNIKIKNPPSRFNGAGLSSSQYTIVS
nr:MAG TPA: protein of unknown function DUF285 [Caudoviricetes sp.]